MQLFVVILFFLVFYVSSAFSGTQDTLNEGVHITTSEGQPVSDNNSPPPVTFEVMGYKKNIDHYMDLLNKANLNYSYAEAMRSSLALSGVYARSIGEALDRFIPQAPDGWDVLPLQELSNEEYIKFRNTVSRGLVAPDGCNAYYREIISLSSAQSVVDEIMGDTSHLTYDRGLGELAEPKLELSSLMNSGHNYYHYFAGRIYVSGDQEISMMFFLRLVPYFPDNKLFIELSEKDEFVNEEKTAVIREVSSRDNIKYLRRCNGSLVEINKPNLGNPQPAFEIITSDGLSIMIENRKKNSLLSKEQALIFGRLVNYDAIGGILK